MHAESFDAHQSSVKDAALLTELLHALVESSTGSDHAASNLADVLRCSEMLCEQALTVERVFSALRAHFEGLAQLHTSLSSHLSLEQTARLDAAVTELRGKIGLAVGALRRWNLGVQNSRETARAANTSMASVRTAMAAAAAAAEHLLVL